MSRLLLVFAALALPGCSGCTSGSGVQAFSESALPKGQTRQQSSPGAIGKTPAATPFCPAYAPVPCGGTCCWQGDRCEAGACVVTARSVHCPKDRPVVCGSACYPAGATCTFTNECGTCRYDADCVGGACTCAAKQGDPGAPHSCGDATCCPSTMRCGPGGGCFYETSGACIGCNYGATCPQGGTCRCEKQPGALGEPVLCPDFEISCCPSGMLCGNFQCYQGEGVPAADAGSACSAGLSLCGEVCCDLAGGERCAEGVCTRASVPNACATNGGSTCGSTCCALGAACGGSGCGCGGDAPVGCGNGCCTEGSECLGGACDLCPKGYGVRCGGACCADGSACTASGCACPASHPLECGVACCPAGSTCGPGGQCLSCPSEAPALCGSSCCANASECRICPGEASPSCHPGACPSAGNTGGTCPGGVAGSSRWCIDFGANGSCNDCTGQASACIPGSYFSSNGGSVPSTCLPQGSTGCFTHKNSGGGYLSSPCCAGLVCQVGPGCGGADTGTCQ